MSCDLGWALGLRHSRFASGHRKPSLKQWGFISTCALADSVSDTRNQVHGFMAARADLKDEKLKADYTKAYEELLSFFHDNM